MTPILLLEYAASLAAGIVLLGLAAAFAIAAVLFLAGIVRRPSR